MNVHYDNNLRYLYSTNAEALSDFHKQQVANFLLATRSSQCRITRKWFHFPKVSLSFFSSSIEVKKVENGLPGFNLLVFHVVVTKMASS